MQPLQPLRRTPLQSTGAAPCGTSKGARGGSTFHSVDQSISKQGAKTQQRSTLAPTTRHNMMPSHGTPLSRQQTASPSPRSWRNHFSGKHPTPPGSPTKTPKQVTASPKTGRRVSITRPSAMENESRKRQGAVRNAPQNWGLSVTPASIGGSPRSVSGSRVKVSGYRMDRNENVPPLSLAPIRLVQPCKSLGSSSAVLKPLSGGKRTDERNLADHKTSARTSAPVSPEVTATTVGSHRSQRMSGSPDPPHTALAALVATRGGSGATAPLSSRSRTPSTCGGHLSPIRVSPSASPPPVPAIISLRQRCPLTGATSPPLSGSSEEDRASPLHVTTVPRSPTNGHCEQTPSSIKKPIPLRLNMKVIKSKRRGGGKGSSSTPSTGSSSKSRSTPSSGRSWRSRKSSARGKTKPRMLGSIGRSKGTRSKNNELDTDQPHADGGKSLFEAALAATASSDDVFNTGGFEIGHAGIISQPSGSRDSIGSSEDCAGSSALNRDRTDDLASDHTESSSGSALFSAKDVETVRLVGRGSGGRVKLAIHLPTLTPMALKVIPVGDSHKRTEIVKELKTMLAGSVHCGQIIRMYGAFYDEGSVYLGLEYMAGGSVQDLCNAMAPRTLSEPIIAQIAAESLRGLRYLHELRRVHRDVKPGNILIGSDGSVKLSDFGISAELDSSFGFCDSFVGTVTYMSPERIVGNHYSFASDVWSLGLTVAYCAIGRFPVDVSGGYFDVMMTLTRDDYEIPPLPEHFSEDIRDFVQQCLVKDPEQRPHVDKLLNHPFITNRSVSRVNVYREVMDQLSTERTEARLSHAVADVDTIRNIIRNKQECAGSALPSGVSVSGKFEEMVRALGVPDCDEVYESSLELSQDSMGSLPSFTHEDDEDDDIDGDIEIEEEDLARLAPLGSSLQRSGRSSAIWGRGTCGELDSSLAPTVVDEDEFGEATPERRGGVDKHLTRIA